MTGLSKIFWGLLLVFVDIRLNQFDIIPDLIGYIIAYAGFSQLSSSHSHFANAKFATIPLLLFSILELFQFPASYQVSTTGAASMSGPIILVSLLSTVLSLYMIYHLCKGLGYVAREAGAPELAEKSENRWKYYLWLTLSMFAMPLFAVIGSPVILFLIIPFVIMGLLVYAMLLMLIREVDQIWRSTSLYE
ncbi:hypothetical protein [Brevibacillus choshinensis]|uniref:Uncharacterized protein n=1 Tax=Brevibacillus choshinensis TaxID=54911 RepID=A0ABX7FII9_BRECH|nr:hypothetical protein [Brevibacillus choshinensis]QRG66048.1 hypothetical protein JNE38_21070 [Brevibacillus choshinensis]